MKLYKVTNRIGDWWVVANHPTEAEEKITKILEIATEADDKRFLTNHFLLT